MKFCLQCMINRSSTPSDLTMANAKLVAAEEEDENDVAGGGDDHANPRQTTTTLSKPGRPLGLACMLNIEISALLVVLRRDQSLPGHFLPSPEETLDPHLVNSLKSLRATIFNSQHQWQTAHPATYLSPFLDVIQADEVPATATSIALYAVLKILNFDVFDDGTPGAREAVHSVVTALTNCRLEKTDPEAEDAVLMRVLQVLVAVVRTPAAVLLSDHAICTLVNTCFQVVHHSSNRADMLKRTARQAMHEMIQVIFARLPEVEEHEEGCLESEGEEGECGANKSGYGATCMVDIFHFLCSMLNVAQVMDGNGIAAANAEEDKHLFALILINSTIDLGGGEFRNHPKLLGTIQDELFYHLIHYGAVASPIMLSMVCSTVLNLYQFLRNHLHFQIEAFFTYVLLKTASNGGSTSQQEVAIEAIVNFCRQPRFIIEAYVNYDCDPLCKNILEETGKLLCKSAFPLSSPLGSAQVQAFEGLVAIVQNIADHVDEDDGDDIYDYKPPRLLEYRPFWLEKCEKGEDLDEWVDFHRIRKLQKKKIMIAADHFNKDEKKGMDFLKHAHLVPSPPDAKSLALFFRYTPGLDKNKIGDFLGDPDELNIQVLKEFTATFDFSGVILDTALRTYLETFRLPGESQKIQRILEAFSDVFFEQQNSDVFVSKDAVYILCYSLIMLNTDLHNPQVKKKMTEEEFIRNNRAINGGSDLPRAYLSELFQSILTNEITIFGERGAGAGMNPNRWADLMKRWRGLEALVVCDFNSRLSRDMFVAFSGPAIATLSAIFEHADNDEVLHECMEALFAAARIARHGLPEILDELLACLCKFTTLLNPYAAAEETLFAFSNDLKPRMATLAAFTIANKFGSSIRGGWRNIVACLLKLKRLKLLPQSVIEPQTYLSSSSSPPMPPADSDVAFPTSQGVDGGPRQSSSIMGRFSQFLSMEATEDHAPHGGNDFEQNLKIIQQCGIGNIFNDSGHLPDESLKSLGRALIFAAAGKGQKFSTPVEEEETVGFCWELLAAITFINIHRFRIIWPSFHDYLVSVTQFPLFSPTPFSEKAVVSLFNICLKLFTSSLIDKQSEDLILKSINMVCKLDKEVLDVCCEHITQSINRILVEFHDQIQTANGWKMLLHFLQFSSRPEKTFDQGVEALISLFSSDNRLNETNYLVCIEYAYHFAASKSTPFETRMRILDIMAESANLLVNWAQTRHGDAGNNSSSNSANEECAKGSMTNLYLNMFIKLAESFKTISLARREELRNHSVVSMGRIFIIAEELGLTSAACSQCFNSVLFAMVDDLHEKMVQYSMRLNSEEVTSMEGTMMLAMDLLVEVYLQFLKPLSELPEFRQFWLGLLRRMDTCMKLNLGPSYDNRLRELVPELLKKMIVVMKETGVLVQTNENDLWVTTDFQIQWIAPSVRDELFS